MLYTTDALFLSMLDPEKIKRALVVDETKLQEELLERVRQHLGIDSRGKVHILDPARYRLKDLIALYLIGRAYAAAAKLIKDDAAELPDIAKDIGADYRVVSARLAELRAEGKVEAPARGESRIVFARVPQILNDIEKQG